jgi:hypothetical protein
MLTLLGGFFYRIRGGAEPDVPRPVDLATNALIFTAPVWFVAPWWAAVLTVVATFAAVSTGHGDGIDFGHHPDRDPSEWPNRILYAIPGLAKDGYAHDTAFMALHGLSYTVAPAIALAVYGPFSAAAVMLCAGAAKGPAYAIGWAVRDRFGAVGPHSWSAGSEWGEVLTGAFIGFAADIIILSYLI